MIDKQLMDTFYSALNSQKKPTMDNIEGGTFVKWTFTEAIRSWIGTSKLLEHTNGSEVASNTY